MKFLESRWCWSFLFFIAVDVNIVRNFLLVISYISPSFDSNYCFTERLINNCFRFFLRRPLMFSCKMDVLVNSFFIQNVFYSKKREISGC